MRTTVIGILACAVASAAFAGEPLGARGEAAGTWVLRSASELRVAPPPSAEETDREATMLRELVAHRSEADRGRIAYWSAGPPTYRWVGLALKEFSSGTITNPRIARHLAVLNVALDDAMTAAWDSKAAYGRPRPAAVDTAPRVDGCAPDSASYPDERAVAAGAASAVLAAILPEGADRFRALAEEAARCRTLAGVARPSDVAAGLALGRAVAARVLEIARTDGSDVAWTGAIPCGPGAWTGTRPIEPNAGSWKTWVLPTASALRPGPPIPFDSERKAAELAEIRSIDRDFAKTQRALYWQTFDGVFGNWYRHASRRIFEDGLDARRAARVVALLSVAHYDAYVAGWEAKFTYWAIRPSQLDPAIQPLFPPPNHPSYPAGHAFASAAIARVLAHEFPDEAALFEGEAVEAAESRLWAGVHFRSDVDAGLALGREIGDRVAARGLRCAR